MYHFPTTLMYLVSVNSYSESAAVNLDVKISCMKAISYFYDIRNYLVTHLQHA